MTIGNLISRLFSRGVSSDTTTVVKNKLTSEQENCIEELMYSPLLLTKGFITKYMNNGNPTESYKITDIDSVKMRHIASGGIDYGRSAPERMYVSFLKILLPKDTDIMISHMINNIEVDIYVPSIKAVFECQGYTWHSSTKKINADLIRRDKLLASEFVDTVDFIPYCFGTTNNIESRTKLTHSILPNIYLLLREKSALCENYNNMYMDLGLVYKHINFLNEQKHNVNYKFVD